VKSVQDALCNEINHLQPWRRGSFLLGHDFSRANNAHKMIRALQAAEKLDKSAIHGTVLKGHDFNRAINTLK